MPNIVHVGGINCHMRMPLPKVRNVFDVFSLHLMPLLSVQADRERCLTQLCLCLQDLEPWVSGEHGFIVFTLGSMVSEMPEETTAIFLEAFRQIPQKVQGYLYRHI